MPPPLAFHKGVDHRKIEVLSWANKYLRKAIPISEGSSRMPWGTRQGLLVAKIVDLVELVVEAEVPEHLVWLVVRQPSQRIIARFHVVCITPKWVVTMVIHAILFMMRSTRGEKLQTWPSM
jgi:hypothetical protein